MTLVSQRISKNMMLHFSRHCLYISLFCCPFITISFFQHYRYFVSSDTRLYILFSYRSPYFIHHTVPSKSQVSYVDNTSTRNRDRYVSTNQPFQSSALYPVKSGKEGHTETRYLAKPRGVKRTRWHDHSKSSQWRSQIILR